MFTAALVTRAKIWKQPKCPSMGERVKEKKKKGCMSKMEYHAAVTEKEILPRVSAWMNLEGIMLSELRPDRKPPALPPPRDPLQGGEAASRPIHLSGPPAALPMEALYGTSLLPRGPPGPDAQVRAGKPGWCHSECDTGVSGALSHLLLYLECGIAQPPT